MIYLGGFLPAAPYWKTYEKLKPTITSSEGTLLTPTSTSSTAPTASSKPSLNNKPLTIVNNNNNNLNLVKYIKPPNRLIAPGVQGITIPEISSEAINPFLTSTNPNPNDSNGLRLTSTSFAQAQPGGFLSQTPNSGVHQSQLPSPPTTTINSLNNQNNHQPTPAPQGIIGEFPIFAGFVFQL